MKTETQSLVIALEEKFQQFRMPVTKIDRYNEEGKNIFVNKLASFIDAGDSIDFTMMGFPMKSSNTRDKVLGILPDYGEEIALNNFGKFASAIQEIYTPGVNINLISDGFVFNDVLGVNDKIVELYESEVRSMPSQGITWYDAKDFYPVILL